MLKEALNKCVCGILRNYGFAAMFLSGKAILLNQNRIIYTDKNIDKLFYARYISKKIRNAGGMVKLIRTDT